MMSPINAERRSCSPTCGTRLPSTYKTGRRHPSPYAGCITVKLCAAGLEAASFSGTPSGIPEQQLLSTLNSSQGSMPASLQRHDMLLIHNHTAMQMSSLAYSQNGLILIINAPHAKRVVN